MVPAGGRQTPSPPPMLYYMPVQSIYNILLPIKCLYSSHILAAIKISVMSCYTAIHTC